MPLYQMFPLLSLVVYLGLTLQTSAAPMDRLPGLLEELDHAGLVQDTERVKLLISEWKKLEPEAAAPWLKEVALTQMSGPMNRDAEIEILRKAVKTLPADKTLHARLAGLCATADRPQESLVHFRWLFEHAADDLEKLSWAMQMGGGEGGNYKLSHQWFLWLAEQQPQDPLPCLFAVETNHGEVPDAALIELARDRSSNHEMVQLERARLADGTRHKRDAIEMLRALSQEHPRVQHQLQLARACIYAGEHEEALAVLGKIAQRQDLRSVEVDATAALYLEECLWQPVVDFLKPYCAREPENYRFRFLLGCAQEESRDLAGARESFTKLISIRRDVVSGDPPLPAIYPFPTNARSRAMFYPDRLGVYQFGPKLPAEALRVQWFFLSIDFWNTYGYTRRNNGDYGYVQHDLISRYHGNGLMIPASLEEAWTFAVPHLSALWCEMPPEQRAEFEADLWKRGLPARTLLRAYAPGRVEAESRIGERKAWECDPMTAEGKAATLAFIMPQASWSTNREAFRVFEKSRPDLAAIAVRKLSADPDSTEIFLQAINKMESPQAAAAPSSQERKGVTETVKAFQEMPEGFISKLLPQSAGNLAPDSKEIPIEFGTGKLSDAYWNAFHEAVAQFVVSTYWWGLKLPDEPENIALLKRRIATMSHVTPRAIVEQATAYQMLKDDVAAEKVWTDALEKHPGDHTLLPCAMQSLMNRPGLARLFTRWGIEPFLNRTPLYYFGLNEAEGNPFFQNVATYINGLPAWKRDVADLEWLVNYLTSATDPISRSKFQQATLTIPEVAKQAFKHLAQSEYVLPDPAQELERLTPFAAQALLAMSQDNENCLEEIVRHEPKESKLTQPATVLLHQAVNQKSAALLDGLIKELKTSPSPYAQVSAQYWQLTRDLYFCDPAQLPELMRRIVRDSGAVSWIAEVPPARGIPLDFKALLLNECPHLPLTWRPVKNDAGERLNFVFTKHAERIFVAEGPDAASAFLAPLTTRCLGPKSERAKSLKNRNDIGVNAWLRFIGSSGSEEPKFCHWLLEYFQQEFVTPLGKANEAWAWDALAGARSYVYPMLPTWQAYGWTKGPEEFDPMEKPTLLGRSHFAQFLANGKNHHYPQENSDRLSRELESRSLHEFARGLLSQPYFVSHYSNNLKAIQSAPIQQQKRLAKLLDELLDDLLPPFQQQARTSKEATLNAWLKTLPP